MGWAEDGWLAVLDRWERAMTSAGQTYGLPLRQDPATESELQDLESRIGSRLPPSYRAFLRTTNGLLTTPHPSDPGPIDTFLPASQVQTPRRPGGSGPVWLGGDSLESLFDVVGNVAERLLEPDEDLGCQGHLLYAIKVDGGYPESYMYLDPLDMDADGEWRAWDGYKEVCIKRRSFGDVIEAWIAQLEQPSQPDFYKFVIDPSPAAEERLLLQGQLDAGGEAALRAAERLIEIASSDTDARQRHAAMSALLDSKSPIAEEAVLQLLESRPDDGAITWLPIQRGIGRTHSPRTRAALFRILTGPNGASYVGSLVHHWPELVDDAWNITGDPQWIKDMLNAGRPGSLQAAIDALARPDLPRETRLMLGYSLGYAPGSERPTPAQVAAILRLVDVPGNSPQDLARALLGWGEIEAAMSILEMALEYENPTGDYLFIKLAELAPYEAVPALIGSLRRKPTHQVMHVLVCIDHPDSAPELARHLNGALREDALIGLEQLGTDAALKVLADRAAAGDLESARALARRRDDRALEPLLREIDGPHRRSAVIGLRDLRHPSTVDLLGQIAAHDDDDNVAVLAAHGLVMTDPEHARPVVEALRQRDDPHVRRLADHWLSLLANSDRVT